MISALEKYFYLVQNTAEFSRKILFYRKYSVLDTFSCWLRKPHLLKKIRNKIDRKLVIYCYRIVCVNYDLFYWKDIVQTNIIFVQKSNIQIKRDIYKTGKPEIYVICIFLTLICSKRNLLAACVIPTIDLSIRLSFPDFSHKNIV